MPTLIINSILLGVGLAMDAFSVSLANGLNEPCMPKKKICGIIGCSMIRRSPIKQTEGNTICKKS